jgi:hypothetical protein
MKPYFWAAIRQANSSEMTLLSTGSLTEDFQRARRQAALEDMLARLTGKSAALLCYPEVREQLQVGVTCPGVLKDIPLNAIVGSVDRCFDFTRSFLPRHAIDQQRWTMVKQSRHKWPPIKVYQVGQVYFVQDGHHRVSVAQRLGFSHIEAYVIEVDTKVTLSPEDQPDDLIVKAEYADFLEHTHLDALRPEVTLGVSVPGQYRLLEEHIEACRRLMASERGKEVAYEEAVKHWYDRVYRPVAEAIRDQGILEEFPGRTETDLYLWLSEHRTALERELGWQVDLEAAATGLAAQFGSRPQHIVARMINKVSKAIKAFLHKFSLGSTWGLYQ